MKKPVRLKNLPVSPAMHARVKRGAKAGGKIQYIFTEELLKFALETMPK